MLSGVYIALVCPYDLTRPGGVRSHLAGLGEALRARGHRVDVVAPTAANQLQSLPVVQCGRSRPLAFGGTQIDLTWASWRQLGDVSRRGYDVMHFHTIWNPAMPFQLAMRFAGPKVATFHDVAGPDTPAIARMGMGPVSSLIGTLWLRRMIAVSPLVARYLPPGKHQVIPNGVAVPSVLPPEGEREAVLFLGRLEPRKSPETLLEAAALLGPACPPIWIAGDGYLRPQLERQAARLGLSTVSFLGEVTESEKWARLRRAAIVVAPSTGGESFGIVLLEAMVAGAPPVAADNPGYRDVLRAQAGALLFPPGDAAALARSIRAIVGDAGRRRELQAWGEAHWRRYDWKVLAARVENVYADAVR